MSNGFTLDELQAEAEKRFADFEIKVSDTVTVRLQPAIRISSDRRKKVQELQTAINEFENQEDASTDDLLELIYSLVREVARDRKSVDTLIRQLKGDLSVWLVLLNKYGEATQVGEA